MSERDPIFERDSDFLGKPAALALRSGSYAQMKVHRPRCPPETCPQVDKLSALLDAISGDLGRIHSEMELCRDGDRKKVLLERISEWESELLDADSSLASCRLQLEELRCANDQLRRSSYFWRCAADAVAEGRAR